MKAAVAVQRKLLEMIYVIFSSGKACDKDYLEQQGQEVLTKEKRPACSSEGSATPEPACSGAAVSP